jgi:transcriptional regulator with XRE-family HTH domain
MSRVRDQTSKVPEEWLQAVGARVRLVRTQRGLSQDALAEAAGVSGSLVGRVETGRSVVLLRSLWRLADGLGVYILDLVAEPGTSRLDNGSGRPPEAAPAGASESGTR